MAYCSLCGGELPEGATTCPTCNAIIGQPAIAVTVNEYDHTADFDAEDISENKIFALCAYALSFLGIIIALLVAKDSAYAKFHAKEALKINLASVVVTFISVLLCWTCIIPLAGFVFNCIFFVLVIIAFIQVCLGKAKEPWLIRSIGAFH